MLRRVFVTTIFATLLCIRLHASCVTPQNAIEAENCIPGDGASQWTVAGTGDPTLQGFATQMSVNVGQRIDFKIASTASSYSIGIFRVGYYGGQGARKVATVTPSAKLPQSQPACITDVSTNLYDCGNWAISASWNVPAAAVSGVYLAVLVRPDTGGASQIIFVVRNDSSASDILFQTSDESWQAYNPFGGHSLYGGAGSFDLTNRAYKVSYNRPFNTLDLESQSWFMYAEYPMVRWLESNGYDVSYFSSVDAASNGAVIKNHKTYISVGHDEYVSAQKRASVEAAREAGVNLAFFSGNEFFWKTRWENSIDGTNTPFRTLVCYKETLGPNSVPTATGAVDPLDPPTWTGTWRDPAKSPPADGGRPENALTGQLFRVNGPGVDNSNLSIKVPAAQGKLRFWKSTKIAAQTAGQTWTLPASTLGYEWDVEEDNGSRPAGLFDLSTATYALTNDYLQDFGGVYGAGTATHHMSIYRAPSGALVFGAGTVQWSWGLDSISGGTADLNMQQATVNLFADMGVQPVSIQSPLLASTRSTDTTPPISTITSPPNGTSAQAGSTINVTGTASDQGGGLVAGVEVSVDSGASWHPAVGTTSWGYTWVANTSGSFTILSRAVDDSANLQIPTAGSSVNIIGVKSIVLNPSALIGGASSQATVTLSAPAGPSGVVVNLTNSAPSVATVPSSITIAPGNTVGTFSIATSFVGATDLVTVTAIYGSTVSAILTVNRAFPPPVGNLDIDASVSIQQKTASASITSGAFSTAATNELLLALVSSDSVQTSITVTGVTGAGLTWSFVARSNAQGGTAEIWRAFASSTLSNVQATATFSQTSPSASLAVMTFAGVDTSGTNGSGAIGSVATTNSAKAAPSASLVTTRNNSWVLGVGNDYANAIARTVGSNQTLIDQELTPTGDTLWSQRQNAATPTSGTTVTINDTAPTTDSFNLAIVEVRPPIVGQFSISGSLSANGFGATVTLTGAMAQTVTADGSGNYSFVGLVNGSYTVTPTKTGEAFSPTSQTVTISSANLSSVNFAAFPTFSISGTITPSAGGGGSTVTLGGASSATTTADGSGNYTFNGLVNGSYTVTPSKLGFGFTPGSQNVVIAGANQTGINFSAAAQNFSISGSLSASGANATVALSGAATTSVTADGSGNYSFVGLGNGSYTVTPSKSGYVFSPSSQNATVSGANVTGLNFTAQVLVVASLAIDAKVFTDGTKAASSIVSPPFSTTAGNELLLAFVATDYLGGPNTTVTGVTGAGLTWTLVIRSNQQSGTAEIWRAFSTTTLSGVTVTAALSQSVGSSMTVVSYAGVDATGTNGSGAVGATLSKSATTGAPSAAITTTRNNSWIFGVGNDFDNGIARTTSTGQTLVHQYLSAAGDTYWVQMQNNPTPASGTSVSISDTAPTSDRWNLALVEVLPSLGPYGISGSVTPAQNGVTISLTGSATSSTVTDASGNYSITGLNNGSYTVTPTKTGVAFSPTNQPVTISGASASGINFAVVQPVLTLSQTGVLFSGNVGGTNPASSQITVTNTGGSSLSFTASSDSPWLSVTPTSGTAPQTLQLSASTSGLALGTYTGHITVTSAGSVGSPTTITVTLKVVMPTDWLMIEHDEARTGNAVDESILSSSNVGSLGLSWSTVVDGSVTAQPLYAHSVIIGGQSRDVVLVGTGGNSIYLLDANSGAQIWKRNFGAPTPNTWGLPDGFGIEGPPVIDRVAARIYTVSTDGSFHTISLADGTDLFTPLPMISNPVTNKVWGGLNQVGNNVYIASASNGGDVAPWRGQVYQVNVTAAPTLAGNFVVVPSIPAPNGGGGIWGYGGVSADLANGNIYAASADDSIVSPAGTEGYTPHSDSVMALNANVGLLGAYQAVEPATFSCGAAPCDLDFASTPLIFQPAGCSQLLAVGNKNGNLYLFRSADLIANGQPLQILTLNAVADSLGSGGVGGTPVYNPANNMVYIVDAGPGVTGVTAGLVAMKVTAGCTLQVAWSVQMGGNDTPNSTPTLANGVVFVGQGNTGVIHGFDANSGTELWHSGTGYVAAATFAAPIVAGGKLFAGSWTSFNGGGIVGAFSLPGASFSISGTVSPSTSGSGTLMQLSGASNGTATADSSGNYSFAGLPNGSYTVTPSKAGFTFTPTSQPVTVNNGNVSAVNFSATAQTWSISGNVSVAGAGATVTLSGAASASTTADSSGNYSFAGLLNGSYTVTPSKAGVTFNPTSQAVNVSNGNVSVVNFAVVSGQTWSISGNLSTNGAGASVALSGAASGAVTASSGALPALVKTCVVGNEAASASISTASCVNTAGDFLIITTTAVRPASTLTLTDTVGDVFINANSTIYPFHDTIQDGNVYVWYVPVAKGGSSNIFTVVPGSGNSALEIHVSEWSGMQGWIPDQSAIANGATGGLSFSSGSQVTTASPELIFGYTFPLGNSSPGAGFTGLSNVNGDWDEYQMQNAAGSVAATFTSDNSGSWLATMVTFKPPQGYAPPGSYSFTGLPNGSYTVTPTKPGYNLTPTSQSVSVSNANVTNVNFTAAAVVTQTGPSIDAKVSIDTTANSKTIVSPAISTTSGNELVLALISTDYGSGANTTVTGVTGAGLTWTLVLRTNVQSGSSEIWRAFAPSTITGAAVTATLSQSVVASMTVLSFKGVDTTGTNGSGALGAVVGTNAKTGAPSATLTTTRNNSLVLGVGNDYDNAINRTAGPGQTVVHQDLTSTGDTYWVQLQTSSTALSGTSVTINDTAPTGDRYNLTIVEVRTP